MRGPTSRKSVKSILEWEWQRQWAEDQIRDDFRINTERKSHPYL